MDEGVMLRNGGPIPVWLSAQKLRTSAVQPAPPCGPVLRACTSETFQLAAKALLQRQLKLSAPFPSELISVRLQVSEHLSLS